MKKSIQVALVVLVMVIFSGVAFAFDPSAIVGILGDSSDGGLISDQGSSSTSDYFYDYRRFRGAGEWIAYIPFSFQVSWGMDGSVKFFQAFFSDTGEARWELLSSGSTTPTWGGFYKIVATRSDEDVLIYGQTSTIKTVEALSYLDLRGSQKNVMLLAGEGSSISLPQANDKYYYGYGALFVCAGQTISADFLKEKIGASLVGIVICDNKGFLSKYKTVDKLIGYSFSGNGVPVLVFKYRK